MIKTVSYPLIDQVREMFRQQIAVSVDVSVHLATGADTDVYLDAKHVFSSGQRMSIAGQAVIEQARSHGFQFSAVGGVTMGADFLSHAVALLAQDPVEWFSVRDHARSDHGLGKIIEGADLGLGSRVLLVDDVVDSGSSLVKAFHAVEETGAQVVAVIPLVDRSDKAQAKFDDLLIPYLPLLTYRDLGIEPL